MVDRLDIVAVRIERKGGIISRVIGPLSRPAIVAPAMGEGRLVEGMNALRVTRLESQMNPGHRTVGLIHPQLVAGKMPGALGGEIMPKRLQDGAVEAPARLEVGDAQVDVIDQAALMTLHAD